MSYTTFEMKIIISFLSYAFKNDARNLFLTVTYIYNNYYVPIVLYLIIVCVSNYQNKFCVYYVNT